MNNHIELNLTPQSIYKAIDCFPDKKEWLADVVALNHLPQYENSQISTLDSRIHDIYQLIYLTTVKLDAKKFAVTISQEQSMQKFHQDKLKLWRWINGGLYVTTFLSCQTFLLAFLPSLMPTNAPLNDMAKLGISSGISSAISITVNMINFYATGMLPSTFTKTMTTTQKTIFDIKRQYKILGYRLLELYYSNNNNHHLREHEHKLARMIAKELSIQDISKRVLNIVNNKPEADLIMDKFSQIVDWIENKKTPYDPKLYQYILDMIHTHVKDHSSKEEILF